MGVVGNPAVAVREQSTGGYVAVDTETGTRVEADSRFFASVALALKLDGRDELSAAVASTTSVEELLAAVVGELSDEAEVTSLIEQWAADDGESQTTNDHPDLSAIRGIVSDATDRSPRELIAESRARDREREGRLTDAG